MAGSGEAITAITTAIVNAQPDDPPLSRLHPGPKAYRPKFPRERPLADPRRTGFRRLDATRLTIPPS